MSVFNRTDNKQNETTPAATVPPPGATATYAATPEAKRPQAVAQPMTNSASAPGGVSVISKALKITGQLESTEDIRIDGEVNGDVRAVSVTVGNNARVKGNVYGETVELAGTVEGKIEAKKVVLGGTARMTGDVVHQDIKIESGAFIDGHLKPEFGKSGAAKTNGAGHA
ncbi:MAG TPA: polymer-forming cytoskeletal protein [Rhizomicrobium sp.]|jgi:cytoskeletal protein CcmA (bactofilin family)|nr:polymer-forming cytoskeletal protein [Rhizomicrobium sp.]